MAKVIVDIEELIENWAMDHFRDKATRKEKRLLKNGHVGLEIDWRRVQVTQDQPKYTPEPPKPDITAGLPSVLFSTTYTNKTEERQVYNFSAERTSRSTCVTSVEKGVTKGHEFNLQLTTPGEIMQANAGFKRELTITNSNSQTIEEELVWGANSEIKVEGGMSATAKMVISEAEYVGKYVVKTTMKGVVRVMFTNKKDNNSLIRNSEGDVFEIVRRSLLDKSVIQLDDSNRCVICTTTGSCTFKYGLRQDVEVSEEKITN